MKWKLLSIWPRVAGVAPYDYEAESLAYEPGLMMQQVRNWTQQGIPVTIYLCSGYRSPLLPWNRQWEDRLADEAMLKEVEG